MFRRNLGSSFVFLGLVGISACGGSPPAPEVKTPAATTDAKKPAAKEELVVAAPETPVAKAEDVLPTQVASVFQFIGKDAPIIINVPRFDKVIAALDAETRAEIEKEITSTLAGKSKLEAAMAKSLMDAFDGAVIYADPNGKGGNEKELAESACLAVKFRDKRPVEMLLANPEVERQGPRFTLKSAKAGEAGKASAHGVWFADSGVILGCAKSEGLSKSLSVATGALPSYSTSPRFVKERANDLFVTVDLHPILEKEVEPGSDFFASLTAADQTLGLDLRLSLLGPKYPPVGAFVDAAPQALLGKMPKGSLGAIGISLKRMPGKNLASVLELIDKTAGKNTLREAKDGAAQLGIDLSEIDAALGDELAVGVYRDPKHKIDFDKGEAFDHSAVIVALGTNDQAAQKKIWTIVTDMVKKKKDKEVTVKGDVIEASPNPKSKKKEFARIESRKGHIVFAIGDKALIGEALRKFDKDTLASTPAFVAARGKEKPAMHLLGYLDGATLKALVSAKSEPGKAASVGAGPTFLSLVLGKSDRGLELALGGGGAMELIGIGAGLAVSSFKSYETRSKTSEAKMSVRFMASDARRAYEREGDKGPRNTLCKSALPVPATIPKGTTYEIKMGADGDFHTGDADSGWTCLNYRSSGEIRYQYEYRQGGNYKGPKRGGPNPGPNGFEVSAEGDLDGDGKTSLFTRTGKVVGGKVVLDDDVFESDPLE